MEPKRSELLDTLWQDSRFARVSRFVQHVRPDFFAVGTVQGKPVDTADFDELRAVVSVGRVIGEIAGVQLAIEESDSPGGPFTQCPAPDGRGGDDARHALAWCWLALGGRVGRKPWIRGAVTITGVGLVALCVSFELVRREVLEES